MNNESNQYVSMEQRLNLQVLGNFLYGGSLLKSIDYNNFKLREQISYAELKEAIVTICDEELLNRLLHVMQEYFDTKDSIYFNLGMKAGATLQVNLLRNFEND